MVESKRRAGKRQTKEITIQLAWDQAPHRGEEEEKIGVGEIYIDAAHMREDALYIVVFCINH